MFTAAVLNRKGRIAGGLFGVCANVMVARTEVLVAWTAPKLRSP